MIHIVKGMATKTCYKKFPASLGRGYYIEFTNCEEGFYHNDNDNICFEQECKTTQRYKYHPFGINICYQSCLDLSRSFITLN